MQSLFCLPFHMNKTSVIAVLLFTFECQLNLTEEEDPGFSPEGRSHSVRIAWQKNRSVGADFLQAQTGSWPGSISKMVKGRHWRELSILMHKEHGGRTGEGALHHAQHREHNESKHQIVATWMRGEEAWGKFLGNQTSLIWLCRKPFVLMPWAVMYYSWSIALGNYCIIWKKAKVIIILK